MKKLLLFSVLALLISCSTEEPANIIGSGTCGASTTWTITDKGVLTISGTGPIDDYDIFTPRPWTKYQSSITMVVIKKGVTSIGLYAFNDCTNLTTVTIPNSVTIIRDDAFCGCGSLTSVTIPSSVTYIAGSAFLSVPNVNYKGKVTGSPWGAKTINGCVDGLLVYTNSSKKNLSACSFAAEAITIPNSVTSIGNHAFGGCRNLTSVVIPNSVTNIGDHAFEYCSNLTSVTISNSVTSIEFRTFYDCFSLTAVTIPNSVTNIGEAAFDGCYSLTTINIPNSVTNIGEAAFANCSSWTSVTIPNSVTSIGESAFLACSSLSITLPERFRGAVDLSWCQSVTFY